MSKGLNKVHLIGNLGKDPELKYTSSGLAVCTFSIATTNSWKNADGEAKESTQWHNITAWRKLAEICSEYLKKGSKVYVEGEIQYRSYDGKDGVKRYVTDIVINEMLMLDGRAHADQPAQEPDAPAPSGKADDLPF